jgi:hypothetical protein
MKQRLSAPDTQSMPVIPGNFRPPPHKPLGRAGDAIPADATHLGPTISSRTFR